MQAGPSPPTIPKTSEARSAPSGPQGDDHDDADAAWLHAYARRGDVAAFERLYRRHEQPMFRYLLRAVGQRELAEDLLSETWLAVCRQAQAYRPVDGARCRTWLYTIAHHKLMDHWRQRRTDPVGTAAPAHALAAAGDDCDDALQAQLAADSRAEPPAQLERRQCAAALLAAVQALPEAQRAAWLLQAEGELTLEQIAQVTEVGLETAKSRLRYARARLRLALAHWRPDAGGQAVSVASQSDTAASSSAIAPAPCAP